MFTDKEKRIAEISKNDKGDVIRITKLQKNGKTYVDVRTWYVDKDGNLKPSKGIWIPDDLVDEVAIKMMESGGVNFD